MEAHSNLRRTSSGDKTAWNVALHQFIHFRPASSKRPQREVSCKRPQRLYAVKVILAFICV